MPDPNGPVCRLLAACVCAGEERGDGLATTRAGFTTEPRRIRAGASGNAWALVGESEDLIALVLVEPAPLTARSTAATVDWIADLDREPTHVRGLAGQVHGGFERSVSLLEDAIRPELRARLASGKPLWITGSGRGGALAAITAARLRERHQIQARGLRLFGPARPGTEPFARYFERAFPDTRRYELQDDLLPHLPPDPAWIEELAKLPELAREFRRLTGYGYAPVGQLCFIDEAHQRHEAASEPESRRTAHLARMLIEQRFERLAADSELRRSYAPALCPELASGTPID